MNEASIQTQTLVSTRHTAAHSLPLPGEPSREQHLRTKYRCRIPLCIRHATRLNGLFFWVASSATATTTTHHLTYAAAHHTTPHCFAASTPPPSHLAGRWWRRATGRRHSAWRAAWHSLAPSRLRGLRQAGRANTRGGSGGA